MKTEMTLAAAIKHMHQWVTEQAIDGQMTQEELGGILVAIKELESFQESGKP